MNDEDYAGSDEDDREEMIYNMIKVRRWISLQRLIELFVTTRKMGQATLHRKLNELEEGKLIEKVKNGRNSFYTLPGEYVPKKMPPSEIDYFILSEMKRLISDIINSGLMKYDRETFWNVNSLNFELKYDAKAKREEVESMFSSREELESRAWSLDQAYRYIQERRFYSVPQSDYFIPEWDDEWKRVYNYSHLKDEDQKDNLAYWMFYYLNAIDALSRELSKVDEVEKPLKTRGKKAAPRP